MSFKLINEQQCIKGSNTYIVKLYFDADTNTQKHEYVLNDEVLYNFAYEAPDLEEPEKNIGISAIVDGFEYWYDQFGPDWRPSAFYNA
jgi:hypothetical protein